VFGFKNPALTGWAKESRTGGAQNAMSVRTVAVCARSSVPKHAPATATNPKLKHPVTFSCYKPRRTSPAIAFGKFGRAIGISGLQSAKPFPRLEHGIEDEPSDSPSGARVGETGNDPYSRSSWRRRETVRARDSRGRMGERRSIVVRGAVVETSRSRGEPGFADLSEGARISFSGCV